MPRLFLALGVLIWALLMVLLRRRRRPSQPVRLPLTSDDPVAEVLAEPRPVSRLAGEELDVDDLRWMVTVDELELVDEDGCNTVVGLDDTVSSYADVFTDGLSDALADQPGIDAVVHADREVLLVRSLLSLPDVQATAIRALLAINLNPQTPRERPLPPAAMNALADSVAATMAAHGFTGRPETIPEEGPGFCRRCAEDGLVQQIRLRHGSGHHEDDGTIRDAHLILTVEVVEVLATGVTENIVSASYGVQATADDIERILESQAVPLCEAATSRTAIVERWVRGLPWSVPDRLSWEAADIAARWGFRKHARDLLKHTPGGRKQAAAVAAKHRL